MTVGLAVLALAFFVLPTRVHERYLFPLAAIAAIPAAASLRWRLGYVLSALATFANMYVVLTTFYPGCGTPGSDPERCNPQIADWLGIGDLLASPWGITVAAAVQAAVFAWVFFQLREGAVEGLAEDLATSGHRGDEAVDEWDLQDRDAGGRCGPSGWRAGTRRDRRWPVAREHASCPSGRPHAPGWRRQPPAAASSGASASGEPAAPRKATLLPAWVVDRATACRWARSRGCAPVSPTRRFAPTAAAS